MASDFLYLYPEPHAAAVERHAEDTWERSFRENVSCSRAIERTLTEIKPDCAQSVIAQFGFRRTAFVLACTIQGMDASWSENARTFAEEWGGWKDPEYEKHYTVRASREQMEAFTAQIRAAYDALDLFRKDHCVPVSQQKDLRGTVLVLSPEAMRENCWYPNNQLWLATGGFGCDPNARGRAVYATCLWDGEETRWDRGDFLGVLKDEHMPEWARERLTALQTREQLQVSADHQMGLQ